LPRRQHADQHLGFLSELYLYLIRHYRVGYHPESKGGMIEQIACLEGAGHGIRQSHGRGPAGKQRFEVGLGLGQFAADAGGGPRRSLLFGDSRLGGRYRAIFMAGPADIALHLAHLAIDHGDYNVIGDILAFQAAGVYLVAGLKVLFDCQRDSPCEIFLTFSEK